MAISNWAVYFLALFPPLFGIIWIYGTWRNWKVFMDPSDVLWFMWLWHWARKHLNDEGMRGLNYFVGVTLLLSGLVFSFAMFQGLNPCSNTLIQQAASPDKKYIASVIERNCGATTPFIRVVSLRPAGEEFDSEQIDNWVFLTKAQPQIKITWLNGKALEITTASGGDPRKSSRWKDVSISY